MQLNPHRVTIVHTLNVPGGGVFSYRELCPAGTVLLSGGYSDPQSDPNQDSVLSSYPVSVSAWAVQAIDVGGPLTLTIYLECAQPNFPDVPKLVGTTVNNATSAQIQCPAGTTVSGGGFKGSVTSWTSHASGNGWKVVDGLASPSLTVFAVCQGGGHIVPGSLPTAAQTVPSLGQITAAIGCPSGQALTGGGYTTTNGAAPFATYPTVTLSSWMSSAKSALPLPNGTVIAQAVCVKLV
jgi:hypothetical protein